MPWLLGPLVHAVHAALILSTHRTVCRYAAQVSVNTRLSILEYITPIFHWVCGCYMHLMLGMIPPPYPSHRMSGAVLVYTRAASPMPTLDPFDRTSLFGPLSVQAMRTWMRRYTLLRSTVRLYRYDHGLRMTPLDRCVSVFLCVSVCFFKSDQKQCF